MRNPWLWFIAGVLLREGIHLGIVMVSAYRARQEQGVSDRWRTEQLQESGKSGR